MKTRTYLLLYPLTMIIFCATFNILFSCSKTETKVNPDSVNSGSSFNNTSSVDERLSFYFNELEKHGQKGWIQNVWRWLVAHSGVNMFGNVCHLNLPCGDCPGFCANASGKSGAFLEPVKDDYQLTEAEYTSGMRLLQAALLNDTIMAMTLINADLVYQDTVYIFEEEFIGSEASAAFDLDSITILAGHYPVSYTHGQNGTTILDVRIHTKDKK